MESTLNRTHSISTHDRRFKQRQQLLQEQGQEQRQQHLPPQPQDVQPPSGSKGETSLGFFAALKRSFRWSPAKHPEGQAGAGEGQAGPALADGADEFLSALPRVDERARQSGYFLGMAADNEATVRLLGCGDGAFLVYHRPGDDSKLWLCWLDNFVPHRRAFANTEWGLAMDANGPFFNNLSAAVSHYASGVAGGPVLAIPGLEADLVHPQRVAESDEHIQQPWFHGALSHEDARTLLEFEQNGVFLVRSAASAEAAAATGPSGGGFELCYANAGRVHTRRILSALTGVRFDNSHSFFENLCVLVNYYRNSPPSDLLCRLHGPPGERPFTEAAPGQTHASHAPILHPLGRRVSWWKDCALETKKAVGVITGECRNGTFFIRFSGMPTSFVLTYHHEGSLHNEFIQSRPASRAKV